MYVGGYQHSPELLSSDDDSDDYFWGPSDHDSGHSSDGYSGYLSDGTDNSVEIICELINLSSDDEMDPEEELLETTSDSDEISSTLNI